MITGPQLRAARGLLDWTRGDLAKAAKISSETVKNIEHGTFRPQEGTTERIIQTFAQHDVEFTENEGVRIKRDTITKLEGVEGFKKLMDDVYVAARDSSASDGSKPICISNVDERLFVKYLGDHMNMHAQRMNDLKKVKVRILAKEQDFYAIPGGSYIEYKWGPKQEVGNVPFYVYGDKLAILILDDPKKLEIMVISSGVVAKAYRGQFEALWQVAKVPTKKAS